MREQGRHHLVESEMRWHGASSALREGIVRRCLAGEGRESAECGDGTGDR